MAQAIKAGIRFPRGERAVCLGLRAARKKERALAEGHRGQRPARGERGTPEAARDPPEPWLPFRKSLDSVTPWETHPSGHRAQPPRRWAYPGLLLSLGRPRPLLNLNAVELDCVPSKDVDAPTLGTCVRDLNVN